MVERYAVIAVDRTSWRGGQFHEIVVASSPEEAASKAVGFWAEGMGLLFAEGGRMEVNVYRLMFDARVMVNGRDRKMIYFCRAEGEEPDPRFDSTSANKVATYRDIAARFTTRRFFCWEAAPARATDSPGHSHEGGNGERHD